MKHTKEELRQWQALPLPIKIKMTGSRIRGWVHEYGEVRYASRIMPVGLCHISIGLATFDNVG